MSKTIRHYFFDDATRTIYHMEDYPPIITRLAYMGTSDNPSTKMAAAVFMQQKKNLSGCKIKEYPK